MAAAILLIFLDILTAEALATKTLYQWQLHKGPAHGLIAA